MKIKTMIKKEISVTKTDFRTLLRNRSIAFYLYLKYSKITFFIQITSFNLKPLSIFVFMNTVYLLLGSNLGNSKELFQQAIQMLELSVGVITSSSSLYESPPWGFQHENNFINQALKVSTELSPLKTLGACLSVEQQLGRIRANTDNYEARTIDIDILLFNTELVNDTNLIIPHLHLHNRRFALLPLTEIAPNQIHPKFDKTISQLLYSCSDNSDVRKL